MKKKQRYASFDVMNETGKIKVNDEELDEKE